MCVCVCVYLLRGLCMYINAFSSLVACSVMLIFIVLSRSIVPRLLNCEDDGLLQDYYYYYYFFFFPPLE